MWAKAASTLADRAEPARRQVLRQRQHGQAAQRAGQARKKPGARNWPITRLPATTRSRLTQAASRQP
jgi:hypothetical protein